MPNLTVIEGGLARRVKRRVFPSAAELKSRLWRPSRRVIRLREFDVDVLREPFLSIDGEEHDHAIRHRHTLCIFRRDDSEIGCMFFAEFQPPVCCPNSHFLYALDSYSIDDAWLAEILCDAWEWIGPDVSDFGNIVELRTVGAWATIADTAGLIDMTIARLFPKHSITVIQAFPLNPKDFRARDQVYGGGKDDRQRDALMRMCKRRLGFRPFPSAQAAENGWMWRPRAGLADQIEPPAAGKASSADA